MNIDKIIKTKQMKLTTARIVLLEIFKTGNKPLSYEDIKSDISMDKATFYRNIAKKKHQRMFNTC